MNAAESPAPERLHVGTMWNGAVITVTRAEVESTARDAAQAGMSLEAACPYPFFSEAGRAFRKAFSEACARMLRARANKEAP